MKKLINKYQIGGWFPIGYDNNIYRPTYGTLLPEVRVVAKGDPRKVNNNYYKAHSRARAELQSRVADRTDYKGLNPVNILEYAPVIGDALDVGNIINDATNRNYSSAGIGAGMFLLPNIIEKPLKKLIKPIVKDISKWTPEQWTAAQDVAIAKGDMDEAQRLRDLHFKVSAPNTKVNTKVYHGNRTDNHIVAFDKSKIGSEHKDVGLNGFWFTDDPEIAKWEYAVKPESLGKGVENIQFGEIIPAYINLKNPVQMEQLGLRMTESPYGNYPLADESLQDLFNRAKSKGSGKDGFIFRLKDSDGNADPMYESIQNQFIVKNPTEIKSADAVTFDDNGVRIPLGKRDNFNINDIRYSLLPFILGSVAIGESLK